MISYVAYNHLEKHFFGKWLCHHHLARSYIFYYNQYIIYSEYYNIDIALHLTVVTRLQPKLLLNHARTITKLSVSRHSTTRHYSTIDRYPSGDSIVACHITTIRHA